MDLRLLQFVFIIAQIYQSHQTSVKTTAKASKTLVLTSNISTPAKSLSNSFTSSLSLSSSTTKQVSPSSSLKPLTSSSSFIQTTVTTTAVHSLSVGKAVPVQSSLQHIGTASETPSSSHYVVYVGSQSTSSQGVSSKASSPSSATVLPTNGAQSSRLQTKSASVTVATRSSLATVSLQQSETASKTPSTSHVVNFQNTTSQGVPSEASSPSSTTGLPTNGTQSLHFQPKSSNVTVATSSSPAAPAATTPTSSSPTAQSMVPTTPSPSLNWSDWTVGKEDCSASCSNVGGTIDASRQCYLHAKPLKPGVCAQQNSTTMKVKCKDYCPTSGTEAFRSHLSNLVVGILLVML